MANWKTWIIIVLIKIFNVTHKALKYIGWELMPLTVDNVLQPLSPAEKEEAARRDFLEPLKIALDGLRSYEDITAVQRAFMLDKFRRYAKTRAGVREEIRKNPDILKTPVDGPIVIVGLPRSGTSMLQRLLASDPRLVSPMMWEMLVPVPPGRPQNWRDCERYKMVQRQMEIFMPMFPGMDEFKVIHETRADLPEECLFITNNYFMEYGDAGHSAMTKYTEFIINAPEDHVRNMFDFYRKCLQCIFYKNLDDGKRLLLKCPAHLANFGLYREAMPKAKFIFTYRNASTMVASSCSLFSKGIKMANFPVDHKYVGKMVLDLYKYSSAEGIGTFKDIPEDSLFCLGYTELTKDPLAAVKKIYSHFKMDLPPDVIDKMQCHISENKQNKHGKHQYGTITDYGISEEDIREAMPEFFEYFKDSQEKLL